MPKMKNSTGFGAGVLGVSLIGFYHFILAVVSKKSIIVLLCNPFQNGRNSGPSELTQIWLCGFHSVSDFS
jgi:hypothetical protein